MVMHYFHPVIEHRLPLAWTWTTIPIQFFHTFTWRVEAWHAAHRNILPLPELSEWTLLANLYYKDIGSTQTLIFVPKTVFHFLHYSQQSLHHVYFLQFSLISVRPPHFYLSLWNLQIALVTDVPGQLSSHWFYSGNQKQRIDYADVRYMSQRSFVFVKNCFALVLSEQWGPG